MTPEEQARKLAEWLDSHPGSDPPEGLDPDVVEAVYALRPDLAPAPRVSADDILAAVTSGPLAPGWVPQQAPVEGDGGAVVPFPSATKKPQPVRWGRWAFGAGTGTLVAMAAAALLVVRVMSSNAPEPAATAMLQPTAGEATRDHTTPPPDEEPAVAGLDEDDFIDDNVDLPPDAAFAPAGGLTAKDRATTSRPAAHATPTTEGGSLDGGVATGQAPELAAQGSGPIGAQGDATTDLELRRPSPKPAPSVAYDAPAAPMGRAEAPPPAVASQPAREPVDEPVASEPAVADLDDITQDELRYRDAGGRTGTVREVQTAEDAAETIATTSRTGRADRREARQNQADSGPRAGSSVEAAPMEQEIEESGAVGWGHGGSDAGLAGGSRAKAESKSTAADLDDLRARAVPTDLPQGELLARGGTAANTDANVFVNEGRYVEAGNVLLPTVTLPAPQGSTNAAQAATWYLAADDPGLARTAAEAGLANTSGNTPERAWLWVLYGDALRVAGDPSGAAKAYGEAVQLNDARILVPADIDATTAPEPAARPR